MTDMLPGFEPDDEDALDVLAIVGSTSWPDSTGLIEARKIIEDVLDRKTPDKIVSGGAPGVDSLAVRIAEERGIAWEEHLPANRRWQPDGFKDRNLKIVKACTRLLSVRSRHSDTYGSGWTADRAAERGKPVERHVI